MEQQSVRGARPLPVRQVREAYELVGEAIREAAVLVLVFGFLDARGTIDGAYILKIVVLSALALFCGCKLEE